MDFVVVLNGDGIVVETRFVVDGKQFLLSDNVVNCIFLVFFNDNAIVLVGGVAMGAADIAGNGVIAIWLKNCNRIVVVDGEIGVLDVGDAEDIIFGFYFLRYGLAVSIDEV